MSRRMQVAAGAVAVVAVAALAAVGVADRWVVAAKPQVPTTQVEAQPSEVTLGCSPGIIDPISATAVAGAERWSSVQGQWSLPAAIEQKDQSTGLSIPSGVTLSAQGGGELRALVASGCHMPLEDQWVAVGGTTSGEDVVLILANPSSKPSVAYLSALGPTGPLDGGGLGQSKTGETSKGEQTGAWTVDVPAGQVVTVLPATWWPDQNRLAIRIQAEGPPLAAWAQTSAMRGEVPAGVSQVTGTVPATDLVLAGATAGVKGSALRLAVPGSEDASVKVRVQTVGQDWEELAGADNLTVAAGTVLDVSLEGLEAGPDVVRVQSDQPVVAQAVMVTNGALWPNSDQRWLARSALSPSWQVSRIVLPSAEDLRQKVAELAQRTPVRSTAVTSASGLAGPLEPSDESNSDNAQQSGSSQLDAPQSGEASQSGTVAGLGGSAVTVSLLVTNTTARNATVSVGGVVTTVPAEVSSLIKVPNRVETLTSNVPIHAAVVVQAELKTGPVRAVWPLGALVLSSQSMNVLLNR